MNVDAARLPRLPVWFLNQVGLRLRGGARFRMWGLRLFSRWGITILDLEDTWLRLQALCLLSVRVCLCVNECTYVRYVPLRLMPSIRSTFFMGVCRVPVRLMALALFTKISIPNIHTHARQKLQLPHKPKKEMLSLVPPNLSTAFCTASLICCSSRMSTTHARAFPPAASTEKRQYWFEMKKN